MDAIRTVGKIGVSLNEYKGEYSIVSMREGSDGQWWQAWGKEKVSKTDYAEKDRPIKVLLGDKKTAIGTLKTIINQLEA
jgi:hypothetical protein